MFIGTACSVTIFAVKTLVKWRALYVVLINKKLAELVNLFTITQTESCPPGVRGIPNMKFMEIISHFHFSIYSGCNMPMSL